MGVADFVKSFGHALIGRACTLPSEVTRRYPELTRVRWRRGGLPPRMAGWCLRRRTVAAVTLGRTVFLSDAATPSAELLLHELRHVEQFAASAAFPLRYLWELRRGYYNNRYEVDARGYAARRLATRNASHL